MSDIIEYDIVGNDIESCLVGAVNDLIAQGWSPLGGIAIDQGSGYSPSYIQAMVRIGSVVCSEEVRYGLIDVENEVRDRHAKLTTSKG